MIQSTLRLVDFMDTSRPIAHAEVEAKVHVFPRWKVVVTGPREKPVQVMVPGTGEYLTKKGESQADGVFSFSFDVSAAFSRQRLVKGPPGKSERTPDDVVAIITVRVVRSGLERTVTLNSSLVGANAKVEKTIALDFAKAIVGHTTANTAKLWFCRHGQILPGDRYYCEIRKKYPDPFPLPTPGPGPFPPGPGKVIDPSRTIPIAFDPNRANTAVIEVDKLQPGTAYTYALMLRQESPRVLVTTLATGEFTTAPPASADHLSLVFASCHNPIEPGLNRWCELAERRDYDLMLLVGDQIYENGLAAEGGRWLAPYVNRYQQYWTFWPMREALRRTPTYMVWDDHEIRDDWGGPWLGGYGKPSDPEYDYLKKREIRDQFNDAAQAYRVFQQSHNPGGFDGNYYYSFRWGPASFFVMDGRSERGVYPESRILGPTQKEAIRAWARHPDTRAADIIFFITPVPIAYLPVGEVIRLVGELKKSAGTIGGVVGYLAGGALAGIAGSLAGAYIGYRFAEDKVERDGKPMTKEDLLTGLDLADHWTWERNQPDLEFVLDELFDLANDVQDGRVPDRTQRHARAVFILGGDVHAGAMHAIASNKPHHEKNRVILQLTSSPISHATIDPDDRKILEPILRHIQSGQHIKWYDIVRNGFDKDKLVNSEFSGDSAKFSLDDTQGKNYATEILDLLVEKNFGRIAVTRTRKDKRTYRFDLAIEGENESLRQMVEIGLDDDRVTPNIPVEIITLPPNRAEFVAQSVPATMNPGQRYNVSVKMRNAGNAVWNAAKNYKLGSQNPQDNQTWGLSRVGLPAAKLPPIILGAAAPIPPASISVAPGQEVTFDFIITAPKTPGNYNFQWQMLQEGVEWFGDATPSVPVRVFTPPPSLNQAMFMMQLAPITVKAGQRYDVSIKMKNAGPTTWTTADGYKLVSQRPVDNTIWGINRVELPNSVAPGQEVTFSFTVTALIVPGLYHFEWGMAQNMVGFGSFSDLEVTVTA